MDFDAIFRICRKWYKAQLLKFHDDVTKWKHFSLYWPFVRGIHLSPVNFPHKGQWRGALMFSLICARINNWVHNRGAGDLRRHCVHYDVTVMFSLGRGCMFSSDKASWNVGYVMYMVRNPLRYQIHKAFIITSIVSIYILLFTHWTILQLIFL